MEHTPLCILALSSEEIFDVVRFSLAQTIFEFSEDSLRRALSALEDVKSSRELKNVGITKTDLPAVLAALKDDIQRYLEDVDFSFTGNFRQFCLKFVQLLVDKDPASTDLAIPPTMRTFASRVSLQFQALSMFSLSPTATALFQSFIQQQTTEFGVSNQPRCLTPELILEQAAFIHLLSSTSRFRQFCTQFEKTSLPCEFFVSFSRSHRLQEMLTEPMCIEQLWKAFASELPAAVASTASFTDFLMSPAVDTSLRAGMVHNYAAAKVLARNLHVANRRPKL